jgi:predicted hydrocarbon binding protein
MEPNPQQISKTLMGQIMMEGLVEIIGIPGAHAVINLAQLTQVGGITPPALTQKEEICKEMTTLHLALEAIYGRQGGQGVALRAGRIAAHLIYRKYGEEMGIKNTNFRLQPMMVRIGSGLKRLAVTLSGLLSNRIETHVDDVALFWIVSTCPICYQRQTEAKSCHFLVGMLQEFMSMISIGKVFNVEEIDCQSMGATACVFRIDKQALE